MNLNNKKNFSFVVLFKTFNFLNNLIFILIIFSIFFYLSFKTFPNLHNSEHLTFLWIFSLILLFQFKDFIKVFNKNHLIKHYNDKIDEIEKELKEKKEIFNVNKEFIYKKLEINDLLTNKLNNNKHLNISILEDLIQIYNKNEELLLNKELLDTVFENKEELELIKINLEDLYLEFEKLEEKKSILLEMEDLKKSYIIINNILEELKTDYENYINAILIKVEEFEKEEILKNNFNLVNLKNNMNKVKNSLNYLTLDKIYK